MAVQNLELKIKVDASQAEAIFSNVVDGLAALGVKHEQIYKAIDIDTNKVIYDVKLLGGSVKKLEETYLDLGLAVRETVSKNLGIEDVSKHVSVSSKYLTETKNELTEIDRISKSRLKGFQEDLAKRLTALKESIAIELATQKDGEDSVTTIKAEAAKAKRRIEEKLQQDIAIIQEKFVNEEIKSATKGKYLTEALSNYKQSILDLNSATDERIAKLKELEDAEQRQANSMKSLLEFEKLVSQEADKVRIEAKRKDTIAAFEELAAKEKEQADLVKFHLEANYNSRKVMYADLMRQMDEADAARAAKEKERAARAPQASRDDRGYQPFASGFVGDKRKAEATAATSRQQTLQEAETRAFLNRRARADKEWADNFDKVTTPAIQNNTKALEENEKKHKSLATHIAEVIGIYRIYNAAINLTEQALLSIPKALIELQTATATLTATFGSFAGASRELAFLNAEANRTGIAVKTLRDSYAQASASFIMAGESAATTRDIFRDINTVATTLHLNADKVSSVFLALSQMFNKGKVQAEELTKQLSQTLPGITNQTAKALGLSAAELGESMKKGLISAHEAVRLLSKQIADTFGGEAFNRATEGLNASLGRLSTSWTLFSESMGKATESTMKIFINGATSTIDALTKLTSHTEQTTKAFNVLLGVLSGTVIYAAIAGLEKLAVAMSTFTFSIPVVGQIAAVGAGIAALGTYFYLSGKQAEDAAISYRKALDAEKLRQTGGIAPLDTIKLQRPEDNQAYKDALEIRKAANKAYKEAIKGEGVPMAEVAALKEDLKLANDLVDRTYKEALQEPVETIQKETTDASLAIAKAHEGFLKATGKGVEAERLAFMRENKDQIELLKKAISEGNQEAVTALMDIYGTYSAISEKKPKKTTDHAVKEAYKTALEDAKNSAKEIQSNIAEALGNIDTLYKANLMSIKDYFTQRKELIKTDTAVEIEGIQARLQLAFAQKDKVAIEKLQGELIKARTQGLKEETKATQEQTAALRDYEDQLTNLKADYMSLYGKGGEAAGAKFDIANRALKQKLELENNQASLSQLNSLRANEVLKGRITDLDVKRNSLSDEYNTSLEKINILQNTGAIGELDSLMQISDLNKQRIKDMEDMIDLQQKAVDEVIASGATPSIYEVDKLKKMRAELDKFKLTADVVSLHFEKVFSDSFANAFSSFVMGTATAKQAFQSFAKSVVQGIAEIIAKEIALKAVKGVMSMFSMAFGGPVSGATAATMGTGALKMAANGDVFSGAGISAYSGSVVDKPTVFPFARGTGLMGEAGPEAILPLKRNAQGKLGVAAENSGQSGSNVYNISVTVQSSKDEKPADVGDKVATAIMRSIAKEEIYQAQRTGNMLNRTTKYG